MRGAHSPASICSRDLGSPLHVSHPCAPPRQPLQSQEPVLYREEHKPALISASGPLGRIRLPAGLIKLWKPSSFPTSLTPPGKDATMTTCH